MPPTRLALAAPLPAPHVPYRPKSGTIPGVRQRSDMSEGERNGSTGPRRGWASAFDPVAGAKAFGEIQAEGLRAAGALVERLVHLVDGSAPAADTTDAASAAATATGPVDAGAVTPWFELWADLLQRTVESVQRVGGPDGGGGADVVQVDVEGGSVRGRPLSLATLPGAAATTEVWLHNGTAEVSGRLEPRCGALAAPDGRALDAVVTFDPPVLDSLLARSSRGVVLSVAVAAAAPPATYRGTVQVDGAPAVWLPLEVVVGGSAG
jgi:hypothetical protein